MIGQSISIILLGFLLGASFALAAMLFYRRGMRAALEIHTKQLQNNLQDMSLNIDVMIQDGRGTTETVINRDVKKESIIYQRKTHVP